MGWHKRINIKTTPANVIHSHNEQTSKRETKTGPNYKQF